MEARIPVIDLQEFPLELKKLREAYEECGCFRIINHKISKTLLSEMKSVVRELLDLPIEVKRCNTDVITGSGYMAPSEINPLYEALGLYDMASSHAVHAFCDQLQASSYQRKVIEKYAQAINGVAMDIATKIAQSLGLKGEDIFKGWPCQFRINKYNFTSEKIGSCGVQIHTDSGFLTVLQEDQDVGGLEVMDKSGTFVAVEPCPDTLLINLGDIATAWSNGKFCSLKHRVQCKEAKIRVSIATFLLGPRKGVVEAPAELIDPDHPRLYAPFTFQEYRKLRFSTKLQAGDALELSPLELNMLKSPPKSR